MSAEMQKQVFISYSSHEKEIAVQVCDFLERNGVLCWIAPRNIKPGDNYATQIVQAIRSCSVLVLLASEGTNASGHVSNEVSLAFDNKKVIIPFKIQDITFSDEYLYFLGRKHWIEAHKDMQSGYNQLLFTITNIIGVESKNTVDALKEKKAELTKGVSVSVSPMTKQNSSTQGEEYRVMSYNDIVGGEGNIDSIKNEIVSIVENLIPVETSAESNMSLLENISENWRVLLNKEGDLVGYWVFVALQEEYFECAKAGSLNEADITMETIEFIDFPGTYKGYILLSGTKPEARTASLVQRLYESMALHFEYLASCGVFFDEICAVAASPMGMSAMRKMGMKDICAHDFGGKVFYTCLSNISENKYFSSFSTLKKLYQEYFEK